MNNSFTPEMAIQVYYTANATELRHAHKELHQIQSQLPSQDVITHLRAFVESFISSFNERAATLGIEIPEDWFKWSKQSSQYIVLGDFII